MNLISLLIASCLFQTSAAQEFTSLEGKFRIIVPSPMTENVDSIETAMGTIAYHTFYYQSPAEGADNLVYMVSYCDYPEGIVFADSVGLAQEFFQTTLETAAKSLDGEVLYAADIQLDKYPGKYWRIDYLDGKAVAKTKAYLAGNRYYAVQVISYHERNINTAADQFFDSFRIL